MKKASHTKDKKNSHKSSVKRLGFRKWFTKRKTGFIVFARQIFLVKKKGEKSRLYETIDELPLTSFVDALFNNHFDRIYRKKYLRRYSLLIETEAFRELYIQYIERINGNDSGIYLHQKKYTILAAKVAILNSIILLSYSRKNIDVVKKIANSYGVRISDDRENNIARLCAERDKAIRECEKIAELMSKNREAEKISQSWYLDTCVIMSTFFKFSIPYEKITTGEFCMYLLQMNKQVKEINKTDLKREKQ